jgi:hypothetical protein
MYYVHRVREKMSFSKRQEFISVQNGNLFEPTLCQISAFDYAFNNVETHSSANFDAHFKFTSGAQLCRMQFELSENIKTNDKYLSKYLFIFLLPLSH